MGRTRQSFDKVNVGRDLKATTNNVTHHVTQGAPWGPVLILIGMIITACVIIVIYFADQAFAAAYHAPLVVAGSTAGAAAAYGAVTQLASSQPVKVGIPVAVGLSVAGAVHFKPISSVGPLPAGVDLTEIRPAPAPSPTFTLPSTIRPAPAPSPPVTFPAITVHRDAGVELRLRPRPLPTTPRQPLE